MVAGARPNFMKIAPLVRALCAESKEPRWSKHNLSWKIVHTGQHYDIEMSKSFFRDLEIPDPDINLEVGSASHAVQTANVITRFEEVCLKEKPDWVLVVGDVNSTMACTIVAAKLGIKVGHVEAGLRSFDRTMPEEINRLVTDVLADMLFTPSEDADENLIREGISPDKIERVGNIMIDTLILNLDKVRQLKPHERFKLKEGNYVYVTLHRPSNVDNSTSLSRIVDCLIKLSQDINVILPVHPRTEKQLKTFSIWEEMQGVSGLILTKPLGYHDSIGLVDKSRFVLTDSGGLQEETTFLKIPCLTLRPNTERPVTITQGTNKLTSLDTLEQDCVNLLSGNHPKGKIPELWDGLTGERIIQVLLDQA